MRNGFGCEASLLVCWFVGVKQELHLLEDHLEMGGIKVYTVLIGIMILIHSTKTSEIDAKFLIGLPRLNTSDVYDYYFICTAMGTMLQWEANEIILDSFVGGSLSRSFSGTRNNFTYVQTLVFADQTTNILFKLTSVLIVSCQGQCYLGIICRRNESSFDNTTNADNQKMVQNERRINSVFLQYLFSENIIVADTSKDLTALICGVDNAFMRWQLNQSNIHVDIAFTQDDEVGHVRQQMQGNSIPLNHLAVLVGNVPYDLVTVLFVVDASEITAVCKSSSQNSITFTIDARDATGTSERTEPLITSENRGSQEVSTSTTTKEAFNGTITTSKNTVGVNNAVVIGTVPSFILVSFIVGIIILFSVIIYYRKKRIKKYIPIEDNENLKSESELKVKADEGHNIIPDEEHSIIPTPAVTPSMAPAVTANELEVKANVEHSTIPAPAVTTSMAATVTTNGTEIEEIPEENQQEELTENDFHIMNFKPADSASFKEVQIIISMISEVVFKIASNFSIAPDGPKQHGNYVGEIGSHKVGVVYHQDASVCLFDLRRAIDTNFEHAKCIVVVGFCYCFNPQFIGDVLISNKLFILNSHDETKGYTLHMNNNIKDIFIENSKDKEEIHVEGTRKSVHIGQIASGSLIYHEEKLRERAKKDNCIGGEAIGEKIATLQNNETNQKRYSIIIIKSVIECIDTNGEQNKNLGAKAVMCCVIRKIRKYNKTSIVEDKSGSPLSALKGFRTNQGKQRAHSLPLTSWPREHMDSFKKPDQITEEEESKDENNDGPEHKKNVESSESEDEDDDEQQAIRSAQSSMKWNKALIETKQENSCEEMKQKSDSRESHPPKNLQDSAAGSKHTEPIRHPSKLILPTEVPTDEESEEELNDEHKIVTQTGANGKNEMAKSPTIDKLNIGQV